MQSLVYTMACGVSYMHCAHLDVLQVWWHMQKLSESVSQLCQTLRFVPHRRWSFVQIFNRLFDFSYEGKQATRLQPLKGNAEPLQAAKPAKSSQNSASNTDINTDVHTDLACFMYLSPHTYSIHTHIEAHCFVSIITFVLAQERTDCLLLWSWPSLQGSCCPNRAREVWNQNPSALAKPTTSTEATWAIALVQSPTRNKKKNDMKKKYPSTHSDLCGTHLCRRCKWERILHFFSFFFQTAVEEELSCCADESCCHGRLISSPTRFSLGVFFYCQAVIIL